MLSLLCERAALRARDISWLEWKVRKIHADVFTGSLAQADCERTVSGL